MNGFKDHLQHVEGLELQTDFTRLTFSNEVPRCSLSGVDGKGVSCKVPIDDKLFSKHLFLLGNIGTGKTNAISQIISQVKNKMTEDDVMVIFDTKGDYFNSFYAKGDLVISNDSESFTNSSNYDISLLYKLFQVIGFTMCQGDRTISRLMIAG